MAINIQNLLSAATAKIGVAAVDAADSARLASLTNFVNNHRNTQTFASFASLPTADSSNFGQIVRVAADSAGSYIDSGSTFYVSYVNQWKQVLFSGDSDVAQSAPVTSTQAQGSNFGYSSGGYASPSQGNGNNIIQKYPFTSDANATDVGDLTTTVRFCAGQSSSTDGYVSGGFNGARINTVQKFPFSSDANATNVGTITVSRNVQAGQSSTAHGYNSGGLNPPSYYNVIDKFPFASDGSSTDVGNLIRGVAFTHGTSSTTHGYVSGGDAPPTISITDEIQKFSFSSDGNSTDVGDLLIATSQLGANGQNSFESGYVAGGTTSPPGNTDTIQKFPFASDANATDVGNLIAVKVYLSGTSSTDNGYAHGGFPFVNTIQKFSFSSDGNATDIADLTGNQSQNAGQQY